MSDSDGVDISQHAQELADELDADEEEVKEGLKNLVEYSVPIDEAKRTIRRRYSSSSDPEGTTVKKIEEVTPEDSRIKVKSVILSAGKRSIISNGEEQVIHEGELGDETGKIEYTAWEDFGLEPGKKVEIEGADVREWDGEPQISIGQETKVSETEDVESKFEAYGTRKLADVSEGDRGVSVEVRVIESEERVIGGRDGETTIRSGVFGDSSGRLPFTDWENRNLKEGESVRLENAYVNEFRGVPQINLGEYTEIEELEDVEISETAPETTILEAVEKGGAFDVVVEGNVLSVKDGSGLIQRCPECGRVIQKEQCRSHGEVEGETDMRTKAILDDGTGALTLVLGSDLTEMVYGGSIEDAEEEAREAMDQTVVQEAISDSIVGRSWRVRGNVSVGEYGANMEATEMKEISRDLEEEVKEVLENHEF